MKDHRVSSDEFSRRLRTNLSLMPVFQITESHWERRQGWRGLVDLLRRRKPVKVIDRIKIR